MKIYAKSFDDIRKARDAWDADYEERGKRYQEQRQRYKQAIHDVTDPIKQKLESDLSVYDKLDFDINVREEHDWDDPQNGLSSYIGITVYCNENRVHDENSALSWHYSVDLRGGELVKSSSSWSGLNATTEENIESLEQTLGAIKYLASVDWESLVRTELPSDKDYITEKLNWRDRPDFEDQMKEAAIEDIIGQPILIKGKAVESLSGYRTRNGFWYMVHRETPKKYIVSFMDADILDSALETGRFGEAPVSLDEVIDEVQTKMPKYQVKKEYLIDAIIEPIEFLEA